VEGAGSAPGRCCPGGRVTGLARQSGRDIRRFAIPAATNGHQRVRGQGCTVVGSDRGTPLAPIKIISVNSHGLSRNISEPVKRSIRERCGFGCILCGSAVVQYHHFSPPFAEAKDHLASGITLLCGRCHQKAHQAGEAEIASRNAAPFCKVNGYTQDFLFISNDEVRFQTRSLLSKRKMVVMYDEEMLIGFGPPEQAGGPLRLFARVTDNEGNEILQIVDNEWHEGIELFDVDTSFGVLLIRKNFGDIVLRMANRDGQIELDRLNLAYKGFKVSIENEKLTVTNPKGATSHLPCPNLRSTLKLSSKDMSVRF
jgi:hypothetical protein